jgi:hypothetical protein
MAWDCEGKRKDGSDSAIGQHSPRSVNGDECPECNLSKAEVTDNYEIPTLLDRLKDLKWVLPVPVVLAIQ